MDKNNVKSKQLVENMYVELREKFRTNPHHEDYRQIIHEVIDDLIKEKHFVQSQCRGTIWTATLETGSSDQSMRNHFSSQSRCKVPVPISNALVPAMGTHIGCQ